MDVTPISIILQRLGAWRICEDLDDLYLPGLRGVALPIVALSVINELVHPALCPLNLSVVSRLCRVRWNKFDPVGRFLLLSMCGAVVHFFAQKSRHFVYFKILFFVTVCLARGASFVKDDSLSIHVTTVIVGVDISSSIDTIHCTSVIDCFVGVHSSSIDINDYFVGKYQQQLISLPYFSYFKKK